MDYEETAGISTPSKEILRNDINLSESNTIPSPLTISLYRNLAKDKTLSMVYELKQLPLETNKVVAAILLTNIGENLVKELVFNVSDTSTLKLDRLVSINHGFKMIKLPNKILFLICSLNFLDAG